MAKQPTTKKEDTATQVPVLNFDTTETDKSYIPDGFDSREDFLKDMREEHDLDLSYDHENRQQAVEDLNTQDRREP